MSLLLRNLKDSYVVVVRRASDAAARSLVRARLEVQGDKNVPWGLRSRCLKGEADSMGYIEDICDQLTEIESRIVEQLDAIPPTQRIEVSYEEFCENPQAFLALIETRIPGIQLRKSLIEAELRPFQRSSSTALTPQEEQRVESCLKNQTATQ